MVYIQHDIDLAGHPKLLRLAVQMRREMDLPAGFLVDPSAIAEGVLTRLWCWALKYADDGDLSQFEPDEIALAAGWHGDPSRLIEMLAVAGLIDTDGDQRAIHDWEDYAGRLERRRKANARRMKEARRREHEGQSTESSGEHVQSTCDARAAHVSSQRTEPKELREQTEPRAGDAVEPVDNFAPPPEEEIRGSHDPEEKNHGLAPFDVALCGTIRRAGGSEALTEALEDGSDLNLTVRRYLGKVNDLVDVYLGHLPPAKLEDARSRAQLAAFRDAERAKPANLAAYLTKVGSNARISHPW